MTLGGVFTVSLANSNRGECFPFLLGLVELDSLNADHIVDRVVNLLGKGGFTEEYLSANLIGACSDGASVMVGKKVGVLTELKEKF